MEGESAKSRSVSERAEAKSESKGVSDIYFANHPEDATEEEMKSFFERFGRVEKIWLIKDYETKLCNKKAKGVWIC